MLNILKFGAVLLLLFSAHVAASEESHHPNHLAVAGGIGWHDSKSSAFLGVDYMHSFANGWGLGAFYEEVNGDFNLQAWGVVAKRSWSNGFSLTFGPGYEYKLDKDKILFLFRFQGGYAWHAGHWSYGPIITADLIEDGNSTYYAGFTVGYGW